MRPIFRNRLGKSRLRVSLRQRGSGNDKEFAKAALEQIQSQAARLFIIALLVFPFSFYPFAGDLQLLASQLTALYNASQVMIEHDPGKESAVDLSSTDTTSETVGSFNSSLWAYDQISTIIPDRIQSKGPTSKEIEIQWANQRRLGRNVSNEKIMGFIGVTDKLAFAFTPRIYFEGYFGGSEMNAYIERLSSNLKENQYFKCRSPFVDNVLANTQSTADSIRRYWDQTDYDKTDYNQPNYLIYDYYIFSLKDDILREQATSYDGNMYLIRANQPKNTVTSFPIHLLPNQDYGHFLQDHFLLMDSEVKGWSNGVIVAALKRKLGNYFDVFFNEVGVKPTDIKWIAELSFDTICDASLPGFDKSSPRSYFIARDWNLDPMDTTGFSNATLLLPATIPLKREYFNARVELEDFVHKHSSVVLPDFPFKFAFPNVDLFLNQYPDFAKNNALWLSMSEYVRNYNQKKEINIPQIGLAIPIVIGRWISVPVLLSMQLYLLVLIRGFRKTDLRYVDERIVPWIPVQKGWMELIFGWITLGIVPLASAAFLSLYGSVIEISFLRNSNNAYKLIINVPILGVSIALLSLIIAFLTLRNISLIRAKLIGHRNKLD